MDRYTLAGEFRRMLLSLQLSDSPADRQVARRSCQTSIFMVICSKLSVAGSRPELFAKAVGSAVDAVSFDTEDAVAPERKDDARAAIASYPRARSGGCSKIAIVRANGCATPWFGRDAGGLVESGLDVIAGVIATADPRVMGHQIGFAGLLLPLGIDRRAANALQVMRAAVRLAAAEAGITEYDAAFPDMRSPEPCRAGAEAARQPGYAGKNCIHPSQIAIANEVSAPRADEIKLASRVVATACEAAEGGVQDFVPDGQPIDAPMIEHARAVAAAGGRHDATVSGQAQEPNAP